MFAILSPVCRRPEKAHAHLESEPETFLLPLCKGGPPRTILGAIVCGGPPPPVGLLGLTRQRRGQPGRSRGNNPIEKPPFSNPLTPPTPLTATLTSKNNHAQLKTQATLGTFRIKKQPVCSVQWKNWGEKYEIQFQIYRMLLKISRNVLQRNLTITFTNSSKNGLRSK